MKTMKKVLWITALIPLIVTGAAIPLLPERMPMSYDTQWDSQKWGSKYEYLIFPVLILAITLIIFLIMLRFERRERKAQTESVRTQMHTYTKVAGIAGIISAVFFGFMQCMILLMAIVQILPWQIFS